VLAFAAVGPFELGVEHPVSDWQFVAVECQSVVVELGFGTADQAFVAVIARFVALGQDVVEFEVLVDQTFAVELALHFVAVGQNVVVGLDFAAVGRVLVAAAVEHFEEAVVLVFAAMVDQVFAVVLALHFEEAVVLVVAEPVALGQAFVAVHFEEAVARVFAVALEPEE